MTTIKKTNEGAKVGRRSRVNSRTSAKVQSNNINTSAVADVVADVLPSGSVAVPTIGDVPSLGVGVDVVAPAAVGLSDGVAVPDGGALSSGCDGADCGRKGTGRNNSTDQTELAFNLDDKETAEIEQKKEDSLYNKVVARFTAPAFDRNKYAAPLIAAGLDFMDIAAKVNEGRKEWETNHPAPACDVAKVLAVCVSDFAKEFTDVVGVAPNKVVPSAVRVFSRPAGCLVSRPVTSDMSASAIVRAVLSWRWYVKDQDETRKRMRMYENNYRSGLRSAARGGLDIGKTKEQIMKDFEMYLNMEIRHSDSETALLRSNFLKVRARLDQAIKDVVSVCPSAVALRIGGGLDVLDIEDNVFTLPENITNEQKKMVGSQFAKVRNYRRQLTAINAALWGVSVVL